MHATANPLSHNAIEEHTIIIQYYYMACTQVSCIRIRTCMHVHDKVKSPIVDTLNLRTASIQSTQLLASQYISSMSIVF